MSTSESKCPVDHSSPSFWAASGSPSTPSASSTRTPNSTSEPLPTSRETSSIPRTDGEHWVYPSEAQFFAAMARKNHNPRAHDMKVVVPIHNAVNERTWGEVMKWETGRGGDRCGGVKLVSFKGRPSEMSLRARWKTLMGYTPPFDRHDWVVDRCGTKMRYIIDFYTGHGNTASGNLSFFLDVRPAFDNWEGVRMRAERFWERWVGTLFPGAGESPPKKEVQAQKS